MFGGGGMNPRKMQQMMEQMGIEVDELDATEVLIRTEDGEQLRFENPDVTRMDARGQQTYQVVGEPTVEEAGDGDESTDAGDAGASDEASGVPDEDVDLIVARTGASEDDARDALEAADGDLAAAVERLE